MLPARLPALPLKLFAMPTLALSQLGALYLLVAVHAVESAAAISSGDAAAVYGGELTNCWKVCRHTRQDLHGVSAQPPMFLQVSMPFETEQVQKGTGVSALTHIRSGSVCWQSTSLSQVSVGSAKIREVPGTSVPVDTPSTAQESRAPGASVALTFI
jgi:hypothetical protein